MKRALDCYAFNRVEKFCETCQKKLKLTANAHIERKRFCSVSCRMKGTNLKRFAATEASSRVCNKCRQKKPARAFYATVYKGKHYLRQFCKKCYISETRALLENHPEWVEKMRARRKIKRAALPFRMETARDLGLSLEAALKLYMNQEGRCAVCKALPQRGRRLALDHSHKTGKPRQFLCCSCNTDLSVIENGLRFEKLKAYLKKHEST